MRLSPKGPSRSETHAGFPGPPQKSFPITSLTYFFFLRESWRA
jgi:hypothetical protein